MTTTFNKINNNNNNNSNNYNNNNTENKKYRMSIPIMTIQLQISENEAKCSM